MEEGCGKEKGRERTKGLNNESRKRKKRQEGLSRGRMEEREVGKRMRKGRRVKMERKEK